MDSCAEIPPPLEKAIETPKNKFLKLPEMVKIPAGRFSMGSNKHSSEKPVHWVKVKEFMLGKYEVTFAEYDTFVEATGREKPSDEDWDVVTGQ